ncbi:hypothetical protein PRNP1_010482 [Phytophthora ramorum]
MGWFDAELVPLDVKAGRKTEQFAVDESPRVVDMAKLAKLKPVFKKDGVMTADNAFSISDGAGAVQLVSGVDPTIMGIGPVPAIRGALKRAGLTLTSTTLTRPLRPSDWRV